VPRTRTSGLLTARKRHRTAFHVAKAARPRRIADCADLAIVPTSRRNPSPSGTISPKRSAQSEGFSISLDSTPARYPPMPATCTTATSGLAVEPCAFLSPRSTSEVSARPAGLCRLSYTHSLPGRRSSRQVGTIARSAQSALCRRRHNRRFGACLWAVSSALVSSICAPSDSESTPIVSRPDSPVSGSRRIRS
jgi:hypothetical protein